MNAKPEAGAVLVAGHNRGSCQMVAQWLVDVGGPVAVVPHPDAIPTPSDDIDTVIFVVDSPQDVALVGAWMSHSPARRTAALAVLVEPSWPMLIQSIQLPVDGVVVLPVSGELLLRVLEEIRRPTSAPRPIAVLPAEMLEQLGGQSFVVGTGEEPPPPTAPLTPREREILELLDRDFSNEEIARILVISPHTVKRHLEHLFTKLAVRSRYEAVRLAHRHGLLKTRQTDRTTTSPASLATNPALPGPPRPSRSVATAPQTPAKWCRA